MHTVTPDRPHHQQQSLRFLMLYALAAAGGSAAYAPFLTLLLPVRVTGQWGAQGLEILSYTAFAGAVAASIANIVFGWLSDRTRNRRGWILAGVFVSGVLLVAMQHVETVASLLAMIVLWQVGLNMMLNPLLAWAGDCVPDEQKGLLGGLLSIAPALGAFTGMIITYPGLAGGDTRLVLNAVIVAAMILPVVFFGRPRPMPHLVTAMHEEGRPAEHAKDEPVRRMWIARLLVQIAEAALFAFLLLWLRSIDGTMTDNDTARVFTVVLIASVPLALVIGRWSDKVDRPRLPLTVTAGGAALGLVALAGAHTGPTAMAAYVLFGVMAGIFLALHSSQTLRVLPRPGTRGRDLGIFNLTNTVPSLVMPWIVLALIPAFGFQGLFLLLAGLSAVACLLLATMPRI
ncbi:MFS transporter [Qipengyuania soli]|uniref:MFS transporter n=1 Tax=Qipengyuania soli TaxID=2782568 RepID=A0A7S8IUB7_9SPHN|nr:MFS transporter [Qipengyuania soli]QPC98417.1 MFS transporter [Qipengyuania soli]